MMQSQGKKPGWRLIGAIVEAPEGLVFFKCVGPAATMQKAEKEFEKLLASLSRAGAKARPRAWVEWALVARSDDSERRASRPYGRRSPEALLSCRDPATEETPAGCRSARGDPSRGAKGPTPGADAERGVRRLAQAKRAAGRPRSSGPATRRAR